MISLGQAGAAVGLTAEALALAVLAGDMPLPEHVGQVAGWIGSLLGATYALALLGLVLLLVPDGHLPSPRWSPMAVLLVGGFTVATSGLLLVPPNRFGPTDSQDVGSLAIALAQTGLTALAVGLIGSAVALGVRLRRARGEERQQLRWMAAAAATVAVAVAATVLDGVARGAEAPQRWYLQQLLYLSYLAFQLATGFAVLRYRLYDIDVIVGRTVRLAVLAVFVTAGYVTAVVAIGSVLAGSSAAVWPSLLAYVLVALAFQPLRQRVDRLADRVVYGARAAPYDSLAELSRQLAAGGLSEREHLRLVARSSGLAVGAAAARATVAVPGEEDLHQSWPQDRDEPAGVVVPVAQHGEELGRIELWLHPGHNPTGAQRRLLEELAAQTALAFRNLRLAAALRGRAEALGRQRAELEASRRRLLTAADAERERVATAIRQEVAVHLDALPAALEDLEHRVARDPTGARRRLESLQQATTRAIESLRAITAGVLPPLLARRGLGVAVQAYAARSPNGPLLQIGEGLPEERLDPSVAAAAYHCCVRAIDGLGPGAHVRIDGEDDRLLISVRGRPARTMPDRQQVLDRLDAVGGHLEEAESPDGEVASRAVLPLDPGADLRAQAAASRSGPNTDLLM